MNLPSYHRTNFNANWTRRIEFILFAREKIEKANKLGTTTNASLNFQLTFLTDEQKQLRETKKNSQDDNIELLKEEALKQQRFADEANHNKDECEVRLLETLRAVQRLYKWVWCSLVNRQWVNSSYSSSFCNDTSHVNTISRFCYIYTSSVLHLSHVKWDGSDSFPLSLPFPTFHANYDHFHFVFYP